MSNENKSIHEFDFSLICEYFSSVERQGPGSAETTIKALSFVEGLTDKSLIAELWHRWPNDYAGTTYSGANYRH